MKSVLGNARKPDIIFHASGKIDITSGIVSRLRLSVGDVIDILTDDEEFYLYVKHRSPMAGKYEGIGNPVLCGVQLQAGPGEDLLRKIRHRLHHPCQKTLPQGHPGVPGQVSDSCFPVCLGGGSDLYGCAGSQRLRGEIYSCKSHRQPQFLAQSTAHL